MIKVSLILCLIACLPACSDTAITRPVKDDPWDYLVLAQFWPSTSCLYFEKEGCLIPSGIQGWTIHGLWPSRYSDDQPYCCNDSMQFNYTEIEPLRPKLDEQWPYFKKDGDRTFLWEHEWDRHGTCAYSLPILQGELKYFNSTLQLHSQLNIYSALSKAKINPSKEKQYDLTEIFLAITDVYEKNPKIKCFFSDEEEKYYLEEIWLCYDKTLNLVDCPEESHYDHRSFMNKADPCEKPKLPLHFESEKAKPLTKGYFVECPDQGDVYYTPIPVTQAEVETRIEFYESIIESGIQP